PLALDAAEAVAPGSRRRAAEVDVDVVPVMEAAGDRGVRGRVRRAEVLHRAVGKDDAPAEGVVRAIALVDVDPRPRQGPAEQDGGVEACRPAAEADDALHGMNYRPELFKCQLNGCATVTRTTNSGLAQGLALQLAGRGLRKGVEELDD